MIWFLRMSTTPVFVLSFVFNLFFVFPWHDGKTVALSKVYEWQGEDFEDEEGDDK